MASLRVRLEFPDNEKFWLFIDLSHVKTIQDVMVYINNKYSVSCHKLWLDDAQLYCKETVRILQDRDLIRVSMREPKKRKIDTQDQQSPSVVSAVDEAINSSPPSKPKKKKKSKEDRGLECENPSSLMFVEPLTETPVVEKKHKKKKQVDSEPTPESAKVVEKQEEMKRAVKELSPEIETEPTVDEATTELDSTNKEPSEEESAKRKRRRRRRKSQYKSPFEAADGSLPQPFEILPDYVPPAPKSAIHVRFDADSGNDTEPIVGHADAGTNGFGIRNQPESNGTYKTNHANLENAKTKGSKNNSKPAVYQSPSAASTPVPQLNALLSLRSAVFSRSSNDQASIHPSYNNVPPPQALTSSKVLSSPKVPASLPFKQEPIKLDPTTFPIIKGLPRVNDLIAFKVLEISENYTPEISDYMQGRITCMSPGSDITVELLNPKPKLHSRGKFEIVEEDEEEYDEEPEVEFETTVTYHWSQMIEPRLIFP